MVIIAKHAEKTIHHTVHSLVQQIRAPDEILVVTDSRKDPTLDSVKDYPVKVAIGKGGVGAARKKGVCAATGDVIAFIDADAVADTKWIDVIMERFRKSNVNVLAGKTIEVNDLSTFSPAKEEGSHKETFLRFAPTMNIAFRRSLIDKVGNFDSNFKKGGEDTDFCVRIRKKGERIVYVPRATVYHLKHTLDLKRRWRDGRSRCKVFLKHPSYALSDAGIVLFHIFAIISSFFFLIRAQYVLSLMFFAPSFVHRLYRAMINVKNGSSIVEGLWKSFSSYIAYFAFTLYLVTNSISQALNLSENTEDKGE